jgi:hypothetical protein
MPLIGIVVRINRTCDSPFDEEAQHGSGVEVDGDVLDEDGAEPSGQWLKTDLAEASVDQSVDEALQVVERHKI